MNLQFKLPKSVEERLVSVIESASDELSSNERLKWILVTAISVLYLSVVLFLADQAERSSVNYQDAREQLSRLERQSEEVHWPQRASEAQVFVDNLDDRFWPGETTGLAEAGFERWIRQTFDQHGTEVRQVQLTRGPAAEDSSGFQTGSLSSIQRIRAKVIGPLKEDALLRFLYDAANNPSWVDVEQLIVRSGRNPRFELDLAAFVETREQQ